jgi:NADH dehydrogenase FAD-containing subunit
MLGVFGVRAARVLSQNLYARLNKAPAADYRPQNIWLSILDLSDGTALALYGQHHWRGSTPLGLKRYLDHSFMALFRT